MKKNYNVNLTVQTLKQEIKKNKMISKGCAFIIGIMVLLIALFAVFAVFEKTAKSQKIAFAHQVNNFQSLQRMMDQNDNSVIATLHNMDSRSLNFSYSMTGNDHKWKPVRIFSDKTHTYIEFPKNIKHKVLPVLFAYKDSSKQLVNYRAKGNYFVIVGNFPQLVLIYGKPGWFCSIYDTRKVVYITNNKMSTK